MHFTTNSLAKEESMNDSMVSVQGFRKRYKSFEAVKGISFEVKRGEIFALLGPNGSGKTTTLESLEGLRYPDGGKLSVCDVDPMRHPQRLRSLIGVQLQSSALPQDMTVGEAMTFFCRYHDVPVREDLLERLGLDEKRRTQYAKLSTGQQRRLALALAVAHDPQVLFLDEPTAGLDVESCVVLHALVREFRNKGATVILATHDMAEAEKLADRAAILLAGNIAAMGSPRQLTGAGSRKTRISIATENGSLVGEKIDFPNARFTGEVDGYALYVSENAGKAVSEILARLEQFRDALIDLRVERPTLEERFMEITSKKAGGTE